MNQKNQEISIVFENNELLAINKPAGVLVHQPRLNPSKTTDFSEKTVVEWALSHYPSLKTVGDDPITRPGIVHRLDKETSGILIIAKTQSFFTYLKGLFQAHEVKKIYLALVWGKTPELGVINKPIGLKPGTIKHSTIARKMKMVKEAITEYRTVRYIEKGSEWFSLVRLFPKTGRTHQLRVHMASIHHPIVGDMLYGKKINLWNLNRQFLHAESIEFNSEEGKRIKLEADLPEELQMILDTEKPLT